MGFASDDLVPLLTRPPGGAGMRFGQGVIVSWNPDTFENTIRFRDTILTNVPVLSGVEALTYESGTIVGLFGWAPGGGVSTWWVTGRIIIPGSGAAEQTIQFFQTALAREISSEIFAARIFSAEVATLESTSSATYTDLTTIGPEVELEISEIKIAVVFYGGTISPSAIGTGGSISFAVSGATTIAATNWSAVLIQEGTTGPQMGGSKVAKVALNAGTNKFTLKYQRLGANNNVHFFDRTIVVIGF